MDSQKGKGGQSTDSLSTPPKITWCLPNTTQNERAVNEITKAFLEKHKKPVFSGIKKAVYSQNLDRLAKKDTKISFLTKFFKYVLKQETGDFSYLDFKVRVFSKSADESFQKTMDFEIPIKSSDS